MSATPKYPNLPDKRGAHSLHRLVRGRISICGIMVAAWAVSATGNWLMVCWWHSERVQWGESASRYQQENQELRQQVLRLQLLASTNSASAFHPTESEIYDPLFGSQPFLTQSFPDASACPFDLHDPNAPLILQPLCVEFPHLPLGTLENCEDGLRESGVTCRSKNLLPSRSWRAMLTPNDADEPWGGARHRRPNTGPT